VAQDIGRVPSGQALVSDEAATHLHPSGFDPSRTIAMFRRIADKCEAAPSRDVGLDQDIEFALRKAGIKRSWFRLYYTSSIEAVRQILPTRALWAIGSMEDGPFARLCWPMPCGTYSGGYIDAKGATVELALCAATMRGHAIAMEARQRTDPEEGLDPKGDSADPKGIAQGISHD
jgi:hypothetical protein